MQHDLPKDLTQDGTGTVLLYSIHRTKDWFRHLGENMGFAKSAVVSCLPGEGDHNVIADFQHHQRRFYAADARASDLLDAATVADIAARCRVLRFMGDRRAAAMILGMAEAMAKVLDVVQPDVIVSFPIDRYVSDVLEHLGRARGVPFYELTVSALNGQSMLMRKGALCQHGPDPDPALVEAGVEEMATPLFKPSYVQGVANFTAKRWLKVFAYFRLRGFVFWLISLLHRDRLNLHYLDAQSFLGHKPRLSDMRIVNLVDRDWRDSLDAFPKDRRLFIGLALFPEASIDYWIHDLKLIEYEDVIVEMATAFSDAGYLVLVKDHPLQFGFRQCGLIDRLRAIKNVKFVPYEENGTELLTLCGVSFTCTGTLGLQAALLGAKSIVVENYYTTDARDFIFLSDRDKIADLPSEASSRDFSTGLEDRQRRIIANLLRGSFVSDFFSFEKFDKTNPSPGATELGHVLGREVRALMAEEASAATRRSVDGA